MPPFKSSPLSLPLRTLSNTNTVPHFLTFMATDDSNNHPPPSPPSSTLAQYPEMIMAAIEALDDKDGSSKSAISDHIESTYGDLPAAHTTLLAHHLNRMKQSGDLVMVKNNYMKPDLDAPPKRGRGRPPKAKEPLPLGAVVSPPRPRGRPPKPRDPFAPPPPPKNVSAGSGKPRGRPPKKAKTAASAGASVAPASGSPRGRGRPPKAKPAVAPVGC